MNTIESAMKKIALFFALALGSLSLASAQETKVLEAYESMNIYRSEMANGNVDVAIKNLLDAKAAIDMATQDPKTAGKSKTWKRKVEVYLTILSDTNKSSKIVPLQAAALDEVIAAVKKARTVEVNEKTGKPKIFEEDQLTMIMNTIGIYAYNAGIKASEQKMYDIAALSFEKAFDLKESINVVDTNALVNAFISANMAWQETEDKAKKTEMQDMALKLGKRIIEYKFTDAPLYSAISDIYLAKGDTTTALKTIADARKQFPQEAGFITSEFNLYFSMKQMDRAKQALDEAMVAYKDDKDMLRNLKFNAGFIYDQKKDYETARKYYREALELDPKFSEAMNNLAGTYLEEANPIINEMNALPLNETAKYKAMKEKASALYKEAGTILEQAYELNPNDKLKRTLADLFGFLGDEEKEMKYSK